MVNHDVMQLIIGTCWACDSTVTKCLGMLQDAGYLIPESDVKAEYEALSAQYEARSAQGSFVPSSPNTSPNTVPVSERNYALWPNGDWCEIDELEHYGSNMSNDYVLVAECPENQS